MQKHNIALVAGGDSGEYQISIESAAMIRKNIDPRLFQVYTIVIHGPKWVHLDEKGREFAIDKNDFSVRVNGITILFDCAFITIHGTPGEDGRLQGYFELLNIPYTTAALLPTALTFNKYFCNQLVAYWGLPVARSVKVRHDQAVTCKGLLEQVSLPVFVKPNKGGSSLGTFFVKDPEQLLPSIEAGFEHDDEMLVEEYLEGEELTCGVFREQGKTRALPVTQIVSKTEARFFDYAAKYTVGGADEITPAPIPEALTLKVQQTTQMLYEKLELKGLARIDYIYSKKKLFFLEVNITPGMAQTSIVPQQAAVAGIPVGELFTMLIQDALGQ